MMRACCVLMIFLAGVSMGGEKEHLALAKEFDRLNGAQDKELTARSIADGILRIYSDREHKKEDLVDAVHRLIASEEYIEKKARIYMTIFTEPELEQVIEAARLPGFELLRSRQREVSMAMSEVTKQLLGDKELDTLLLSVLDNDAEMLGLAKKLDFRVIKFEVLKTCRALAATDDLDQTKGFIRDPERVLPLMREFYKDEDVNWEPPSVQNLEVLDLEDGIYMCAVDYRDYSAGELFFELVGDRYLLDWESWVGHSDLSWKKFKELKPTRPFLVRVVMNAYPYYNFGFQDEKEWASYTLESPDGEQVIYGYVKSDSPLVKELNSVVWASDDRRAAVTLRVKYGEGKQQANQVLITELVTGGWVVRDGEEDGAGKGKKGGDPGGEGLKE